jgi:hypothetical protein
MMAVALPGPLAAMTTNWSPVNPAAADPTMTWTFSHAANDGVTASPHEVLSIWLALRCSRLKYLVNERHRD